MTTDQPLNPGALKAAKEGATGSVRPRRMSASAWITIFFAVVILVPAFYGFATKFREFILLYRGDVDGSFALVPILNYLLSGMGFLFLFVWAIWHGMFRDIEKPKYTMLQIDEKLNEEEEAEAALFRGDYPGYRGNDSRFRGDD